MAERRIQLTLTVVLSAAWLAACGASPQAGAPADEAARSPISGPAHRDAVMRPATASLLEQGRAERRFGHRAQAAATLERAIRIDPGEPALWLELARLRRDDGNGAQAEQLARKAQSLANSDSEIAALAVELIDEALAMQGQNAELP